MLDKLKDLWSNSKEFHDQTAHFLWAFIPIAIVGANPITGAIAGALFALPREWEQHDKSFKPSSYGWRSYLDVVCFAIGGFTAGVLF